MLFIKKKQNTWLLDAYFSYLDEIKDKLPSNTREFVFLEGHYDIKNYRCPHDSWVESLEIIEISSGSRGEFRTIDLKTRFLGSFHDGYFELVYKNVSRYTCSLQPKVDSEKGTAHGDWIIDEVCLQSNGLVLHEIIFSNSASWKIVCSDIAYRWIPSGE